MMEDEFEKLHKMRMLWEVIQFFGIVGLIAAGLFFVIWKL